mgnify:CR=1 FL=1
MDRIFLDMDDVIVDFVRGVKELTGKSPLEFGKNLGAMWKAIAGVGDFYSKLQWMPDGKDLWEGLKPFEPILLTGIPHGHGWTEQKYRWIHKNLDPIPQCIIKHPGTDKLQSVFNTYKINAIPEDETWILIDDTPRMANAWTAGRGKFILHKSAEKSLEQLLELLED